MAEMRILGLSGHYHDSAAALLVDGRVVAAAQEERFTRKKHDSAFPLRAATWCLAEGGLGADDLDAVVWYEKPYRKFDRLFAGFIDEAPRGFGRFLSAVPRWLASRLWVRSEIERTLDTVAPVHFVAHHEAHAAAAFGPSPFPSAAILTLDGVGEWTTNGLWSGEGATLTPLAEIRYPDSLGLLYSAFTAYCGFRVNDGEYKLMGLAPYGEPTFADRIREHLVDVRPDGSYRLAPELFAYRYRDQTTTAAFHDRFGGPPRRADEPLTKRHADLARSIQAVTEDIVLAQARHARATTGHRDLGMAGGVALNCVANGRLARERIFDRVWIQPAAGDAGGALGAAWALWFRLARPAAAPRGGDLQQGSLLGPAYGEDEMEAALRAHGLPYARRDDDRLVAEVAEGIANGEAFGWYQGRMEYGPRALGNRSILADARNARMQSRINRAVKFREGFRPFAPMVAEDEADRWFDLPSPSPYMLLVGPVRDAEPAIDPLRDLAGGDEEGVRSVRSPLPAITHVDCSARVQTVADGSNPRLERLLKAFRERTGCGVLLNTSFNVKDEPIVNTPDEAVACFLRTKLDRLVLGPFVADRPADRPGGDASVPAPPKEPPKNRPAWKTALEIAAGLGVAALLWQVLHRPVLAVVALSLTVGMGALGLLWPAGRAGVEAGFTGFFKGVAWVLVFPLLAAAFLLVVTPAGVMRRARRRGESAPAAGETASGTYWRPPADPDHDSTKPY